MCDFRKHDRRTRKRKIVKDTFMGVYFRSKRTIDQSLDKLFGVQKRSVIRFSNLFLH